MDVFFAFPSVLLAVAISGSLGGGISNQIAHLTIILIPPLCRVAETATSQVRTMDFVDAARSTDASTLVDPVHTRLINVMSPVLVYASTLVSVSIILASGLSFLGPWRLAADAGLGADAVDLRSRSTCSRWSAPFRASPSSSRPSPSTWSATACVRPWMSGLKRSDRR